MCDIFRPWIEKFSSIAPWGFPYFRRSDNNRVVCETWPVLALLHVIIDTGSIGLITRSRIRRDTHAAPSRAALCAWAKHANSEIKYSDQFYTEKILRYWLLLSTRLSRVAERKISPTRLSSVVERINRFSAVTIRISHTNAATIKSSAFYTTL